MSAALDRLKKAIASAGDADHALARVVAGDVASTLKAVPEEALKAAIEKDPAGGPRPFVPADLLLGVAKLPPQAEVLQLAKQLAAAVALVPS